jgi:tetratricopeptide (TPR) repeat protein
MEDEINRHGPSARSCEVLAVVYVEQGNWEKALALLESAKELGSPLARYEGNKGLVLWKLGRITEALPLLESAYERSPKDLAIICNYGSLLTELGNRDLARTLLAQAHDLVANAPWTIWPFANRKACWQKLEKFRRKIDENSIGPPQ